MHMLLCLKRESLTPISIKTFRCLRNSQSKSTGLTLLLWTLSPLSALGLYGTSCLTLASASLDRGLGGGHTGVILIRVWTVTA